MSDRFFHRCAVLTAAAVSFTVISAASAALSVPRNGVVWDATFEGDVSPPTGSTPAWTSFDTQGAGANQSTDGDLYTINTTQVGAAVSYGVTSNWSTGGSVRTTEIRTRVIPETYEATDGAAGIILGVNGVAFNLRFHTGFISYNAGGLNSIATLDTTQFHTYRMITDLTGSPNFSLYIDGATTPNFTSNGSWFFSAGFDTIVWGDFSTGGLAGHTETDYISWSAGAHSEVPEPTAVAGLSVAGALLIARRRRGA